MTSPRERPAPSILLGLPLATREDVVALRRLRERTLDRDEIAGVIKAIPEASPRQLRLRPNSIGEPFTL